MLPASDSCQPSHSAGAAVVLKSPTRSSFNIFSICWTAYAMTASRVLLSCPHRDSIRNHSYPATFVLLLAASTLNTFYSEYAAATRLGTRQSDPAPDRSHGATWIPPPLSVDTIIIDSIAKGTAAHIAYTQLGVTVMPYGVSTHRSSFAATMNAGGRAFEDFWVAVIDVLAARGFDRFYLDERTRRQFIVSCQRCEIRG